MRISDWSSDVCSSDLARLSKAELVTEMVGEFPELQGVMGGYYARAEGLPEEVANAIRDHYKPLGQGDHVPTEPITVAVSLADKLDTLAAFFFEELLPTGSRDPFALRRAALGAIGLILNNHLRVGLFWPVTYVIAPLAGQKSGLDAARKVNAVLQAKEDLGLTVTPEEYDDTHSFALGQILSDEAKGSMVNERIMPARVALLD